MFNWVLDTALIVLVQITNIILRIHVLKTISFLVRVLMTKNNNALDFFILNIKHLIKEVRLFNQVNIH